MGGILTDKTPSVVADAEPEKLPLLFKYLDTQGAARMLYNGNLQFTNATRLNDLFDCHPGLIDFSKISPEQAKPWGRKDTISLKVHPYERNRERAWLCCLSKINNSLPMWTFYAKNHTGVCVGLDIEKVKPHIHYMLGTMVFNDCWDVQYRDVIEKPDFFERDNQDFFMYQMLTKAKEWEYEQEVRMFIFDPHQMCMDMYLPYKPKKGEVTDWKEVRAYPKLSDDCFAAIYLGLNIDKTHKRKIIEFAKKRNPDIKIYQMQVDPDALKLGCVEVD